MRIKHQHIGIFIKKLLRKRLTVVLFCLSFALLITAAISGLIILHEGETAKNNARKLLEAYKQDIPSIVVPSATQVSDQAPQASVAPKPCPTQTPIPQTYEGYEVLGILMIDKLDLELPVISEMSKAALKVSCCYYQGSMPGQVGNIVITGHNYADGSIFGTLDQLEAGDEIILYTQLGAYTYYVYESEVIKPDNAKALDIYENSRTLTLMTCTSHGNRRLLVRCCENNE